MKSLQRTLLVAALLSVVPPQLLAGTLRMDVGGVRVELSSEPENPGTGRPTTYMITLTHADGAPLTGAKATLRGRMADGMSVIAPLLPTAKAGIYRGRVLFTMGGRWELRLRVAGKGAPFEVPLSEDVSR